jgi:hypothetical protein
MNQHVSYELYLVELMERVWKGASLSISGEDFNNMCNVVAWNAAANCCEVIATQRVLPRYVLNTLKKIDCQIRTVTVGRTAITEEKLQPKEFDKLAKFINSNFKHLMRWKGQP